ncbi:glucosaminidase domain-containing protein [[Clostridium] innocuum]|nr:glucosaminidase domain-containing protein [[Clostridium] innocuum]
MNYRLKKKIIVVTGAILATLIVFVGTSSKIYASSDNPESESHIKNLVVENELREELYSREFAVNGEGNLLEKPISKQQNIALRESEIELQKKYIKEKKEKEALEKFRKREEIKKEKNDVIVLLDKAFENKLSGQGEYFYKQCKKYSVDPYLAAAIAILESYRGSSTIATYNNNIGGMRVAGNWLSFGTIEEGITAFIKNIGHNYVSYGLDTPETMVSKYAEGSSTWVQSVNEFYYKLKQGNPSWTGTSLSPNVADPYWL